MPIVFTSLCLHSSWAYKGFSIAPPWILPLGGRCHFPFVEEVRAQRNRKKLVHSWCVRLSGWVRTWTQMCVCKVYILHGKKCIYLNEKLNSSTASWFFLNTLILIRSKSIVSLSSIPFSVLCAYFMVILKSWHTKRSLCALPCSVYFTSRAWAHLILVNKCRR